MKFLNLIVIMATLAVAGCGGTGLTDEQKRQLDLTAEGDIAAPKITLTGAREMQVEAGTIYVEPGYSATSLEEGSLTSKVKVVGAVNAKALGEYQIIYSVTDSIGREASVTRLVKVSDTTAPIISLKGASALTIERTEGYAEAGALAIDSFEGDVSSSITISTSVNTMVAGTYALKYTAKDSSGNESVFVQRTVTVQDTRPPVVSITSPATNGSVVISSPMTVQGVCERGLMVSISGDVTSAQFLCPITDSYSQSVVISGGTGSKTINVGQTDLSMNSSAASRSVTFDPDGPTVSITSHNNNFKIKKNQDSDVDVQGSCSENGLNVALVIENTAAAQALNFSATCNSGTYSVANANISSLADGLITIRATHIDAQNRQASTSVTGSKDVIPPVLSFTAPAAGSTQIKVPGAMLAVSGACETGIDVVVTIGTVIHTVSCVGSVFTSSFDLGVLPTGNSVAMTAQSVDSVGNSGTVSRNIKIVLPSVKLKGNASFSLMLCNTYNEPGAYLDLNGNDAQDGGEPDVTDVAGTVNIYASGTYALTYSISGGISAVRNVVVSRTEGSVTYEKGIHDDASLSLMRSNTSQDFFLCDDVVLVDKFDPIPSFSGKLNGNGNKISKLEIAPLAGSAALIRTLNSGAEVFNLTIEVKEIEALLTSYAGVVAVDNSGKITKVKIRKSAGAASVQVKGLSIVGGVVARNRSSGVISQVSSDLVIEGGLQVGGLVGKSDGGSAKVENSYAMGDVSGVSQVGGLMGRLEAGSIVNSYAAADVNASFATPEVGGLVGSNANYDPLDPDCSPSGVSGSFFDADVSGDSSSGLSCYFGQGLDTNDMKLKQIYEDAGWSDTIWKLKDGDYPDLK